MRKALFEWLLDLNYEKWKYRSINCDFYTYGKFLSLFQYSEFDRTIDIERNATLSDLQYVDFSEISQQGSIRYYSDSINSYLVEVYDDNCSRLLAIMYFSSKSSQVKIRLSTNLPASEFAYIDILLFILHRSSIIINDGFVLHASSINYNGRAIVFSGESKMGKSTQTALWNNIIGTETINGDRSNLILYDNQVNAIGSPWSGSDSDVINASFPTLAIVLLEKHKDNVLELLTPEEAARRLIPRVFMPYYDKELTSKALDNLDRVISRVPIYLLKCRPDVDAVNLLKKELDLLI